MIYRLVNFLVSGITSEVAMCWHHINHKAMLIRERTLCSLLVHYIKTQTEFVALKLHIILTGTAYNVWFLRIQYLCLLLLPTRAVSHWEKCNYTLETRDRMWNCNQEAPFAVIKTNLKWIRGGSCALSVVYCTSQQIILLIWRRSL